MILDAIDPAQHNLLPDQGVDEVVNDTRLAPHIQT